MRIALVFDLIYPFSIGGVESRNFSLAKNLALKGHEVHLFGVKMWKGQDDIKVSRNLFVHGVSRYSGKYSFNGNRKKLEPLIYSFFLFFKLLKYDFDVVDVSAFPYFPVFSVKAYSILKKKAMNITWHEAWNEFWDNYGLAGSIGKIIEKICAHLSNNNLCVSALTKEKLGKIGNKRSVVIENWIELSDIEKAKKLNVNYDILSIGRHIRTKNFDFLIKVIAVLKKDFPHIKALIIGEGPETINLLRMRAALNLEDNIEILGYAKDKEDIYRYMKSSKLFVLASELEGFSIVSFEAMASGLPVLTIDSGRNALAGYITDGENGYVCRKNEIELALKIKGILKSKGQLAKMSNNAKEFASQFDVKDKTGKIENYFLKLISANK